MNRLLQQQLAKVIFNTNNDQSRVTAIKELDKLGDDLDVTIFDEWVDTPTDESEEVETKVYDFEFMKKLAGAT